MALKTFEGKVYKQLFELVDKNYDKIKSAKPNVSKDSTGYHLWDVWDKEKGIFDITKAIVGAQGTLGLVTDIDFKVVKARPEGGLLVIFLKNTEHLGGLINTVVGHKPSRFEAFDNKNPLAFYPFYAKLFETLGVEEVYQAHF